MVLDSHLLELLALKELRRYKELYGPLEEDDPIYVDNGHDRLTQAHVKQLLEQRLFEQTDDTQKLLDKSRYFLQVDILKQFPYYLFWKNEDSVYCGCNEHFARLVGLKNAEEIVGKTDYDLPGISTEKASTYKMIDQKVMSTGIPAFDMEASDTGENSVMYVKKIPLKDPKGKILGILGFCWYRTDRRLELVQLQETQERLDTLLDQSEMVMIEINNEGMIVFVNSYTSRVLGYESQDILGKPLQQFLHKDDLAPFENLLKQRYQKGTQMQVLRLRHLTQKWVHIKTSIKVSKPSNHSLLLSQDITKQVQKEQAFAARIRELERQLAIAKQKNVKAIKNFRDFALHVHHDLGSNISRQKNFITQFKKQSYQRLEEEGQEYFSYIENSCALQKDMLEGILEYSKLTTKKILFRQVDLNDILEGVKVLLQSSIEECKVEIKMDSLPSLVASHSQMLQIFTNLICNAIKYSKIGIQPEINITVEETKDFYQFCVEDNGLGIDPDSQDAIFVLFKRLEQNEQRGCGIGLAICRKIIENHKGKIWCESEVGKGTKMFFSISRLLISNE